MQHHHILCLVFLSVILVQAESRNLAKREDGLDPKETYILEEIAENGINRDKRHVDVATGVKNALLGFIFNKINGFIDQKTAWVDQLDKQNIAKNAAANIVAPADPVTALSSVISGAIGQKLQAAAPFLNVITNKLGSLSSGGNSGFGIGSLISKGFGSSSGGSSGGAPSTEDV